MHWIDEDASAELAVAPESGMGYQLVRLEQQKHSPRAEVPHFVILNAEWAIETGPDWRPIR